MIYLNPLTSLRQQLLLMPSQMMLSRNCLPFRETMSSQLSKSHVQKFSRLLVGYRYEAAHDHNDVKMKLFALSLEEDSRDWFLDLDDNSYKTLDDFQTGFKEKWGEKKEPRHQLASLHNIKNMENKTMDVFNKKFRD